MSLETGTRIADLVPTNPVGATDFASQGDDHIRLIKACVQGSFPSLGATAVTASGAELNILDGATLSTAELNILDGVTSTAAELNILDGATLSTAELNILDGVTLSASQINDAARKGATNSFTQPNTFSNVVTIGDSIVPDSNGARSLGITGTRFADVYTTNLNGFAVTDIARLSQGNTFTGSPQKITAAIPIWTANGTSASPRFQIENNGTRKAYFVLALASNDFVNGLSANDAALCTAGGKLGFSINDGGGLAGYIDSSGNWRINGTLTVASDTISLQQTDVLFEFKVTGDTTDEKLWWLRANTSGFFVQTRTDAGGAGQDAISITRSGTTIDTVAIENGAFRAPKLPNSTSTTIVKGQIHHITGNATLPALNAGEWCCIVNNSGSAITITKGGTTAYWTAAGVSVSTVTLAARGRLVASGAGSSTDYISGDITGYT